MKILHVVPGLNEKGNGIAVAAKLIAREQAKAGAEVEVVDTREFVSSSVQPSTFNLFPRMRKSGSIRCGFRRRFARAGR